MVIVGDTGEDGGAVTLAVGRDGRGRLRGPRGFARGKHGEEGEAGEVGEARSEEDAWDDGGGQESA